MKIEWLVLITGKGKKAKKNLSTDAYRIFIRLIMDLKKGPEQPSWKHYSKLGKTNEYHCHLKRGKPTYVACWIAYKKNKTIEVHYAGTHENAPY